MMEFAFVFLVGMAFGISVMALLLFIEIYLIPTSLTRPQLTSRAAKRLTPGELDKLLPPK